MILALSLAGLALVGHATELPVHPSHLLVKARGQTPVARIEETLQEVGARSRQDLPQIGWRVLEVAPERLLLAKAALEASQLFEKVELDRASRLAHTPNDPFWGGMWHMRKIRADVAWDLERGDPAVRVAVIDTGLETTHPDLAANVWTNPGEIAGNGIDDDGNGYVDDLHGYDFAYGDGTPDDVYGHGTACAGIVAAVQDNGIGVTGVAPYCQIAGLKAAIDSGYLYDSAVVPALLYAADMGFQVASMSFYGDQVTSAQKDAVDYCYAHGVLLVAAAGNDSHVYTYYPGSFEHVLSVGSSEYSDFKSWFSNWGSWVDVAAPGEGLSTTTTFGGYTTGFAGTSGACPHVAGLAALLFSYSPGAGVDAVRAAIEDGAVPLDQAPYGRWSLYGRVDAENARARLAGTSTGSVPPRLTYVAPCGGGILPLARSAQAAALPDVLWQGVGFEQPNLVRVLRGGQPLSLVEQGRQVVVTRPSNLPSTLAFEVGGVSIASLEWQLSPDWLYAPSDANTTSSGSELLQGGFFELYRKDGLTMSCTRASDGVIRVDLIVRELRPTTPSAMMLQFKRAYQGSNGATERVRLYDWSTWSYPYGNFVTVSTRSISSSASEDLSIPIPGDPARFVDVNGTVYLQIETSGTGGSGKLLADCLRLAVH